MPAWVVILEWLTRLVMLLLLGLSVWSVAIMIERHRFLGSIERAGGAEALRAWINARDLAAISRWLATGTAGGGGASFISGIAAALLNAPIQSPDQVERAVRSYVAEARPRLERGLTVARRGRPLLVRLLQA